MTPSGPYEGEGGQGDLNPLPRSFSPPYSRPFFPYFLNNFSVHPPQNSDFFPLPHPPPPLNPHFSSKSPVPRPNTLAPRTPVPLSSPTRRFGVIGSWSLVWEFNFIITRIDSAQILQLPSESSGAYWQQDKVEGTETYLMFRSALCLLMA